MCNGSKSCMNCFFKAQLRESLLCSKRKIGRLIVDAFYCCPLWVPDRRCR